MNKKSVFTILIIIALIFVIWYLASNNKAIDKIQDYTITVTPQDDGTLNILYDITWEVLDSKTEGPLTWVQIGLPNPNVDSITALTDNIKSIEQYNSNYVRIDFKNSYETGNTVHFRYKIHQKNMYSLKNGKCIYEFTPGWFKKIAVDKITIKWKAGNVLEANTNTRENGYYIWTDSLKKNEKLVAKIEYNENTYTGLSTLGEFSYVQNNNSSNSNSIATFVVLLVIALVFIAIGSIGSDGYDRHRGYYGSHSSCDNYHSSCACVSSCACACACAGGGRAGCSKKDFYGTKLKSKNILEKL